MISLNIFSFGICIYCSQTLNGKNRRDGNKQKIFKQQQSLIIQTNSSKICMELFGLQLVRDVQMSQKKQNRSTAGRSLEQKRDCFIAYNNINFKILIMQNSVIQIGNYSYYPNKALGQGTHSTVYLGFRNKDKQPVAVKTIRVKQINSSVKKHLLECEVAALSTLKSRYICQTYEVLKDGQFYFVPLQYCNNGTLRDYVKAKGKLTENEAIQIFSKILQGYSTIRQAGFVHRDLKSQNILLRGNMEPAISDFGYCEKTNTQNQRLSYNVGSPAYMSPEAYNESIYSEKSDVWALGIVLHEMLSGTIPVMRTTDVDEYFKYLKNMKTAEIIQGSLGPLSVKLLLNSLAVDTRLRYSCQQLIDLIRNQTNQNSPTRSKTNSSNYEPFSPLTPQLNRAQTAYSTANRAPVQVNTPLRNLNTNNWNRPPNLPNVNQWSGSDKMSNISNASNKNYSIDSPTLTPNQRPPLPNSNNGNNANFGNLRKRIQHQNVNANTNTNSGMNFAINLTPIRINHNEDQYQRQMYYQPNIREPMTPNVLFTKNQKIQYSQPTRLRKSHSSSNTNMVQNYNY